MLGWVAIIGWTLFALVATYAWSEHVRANENACNSEEYRRRYKDTQTRLEDRFDRFVAERARALRAERERDDLVRIIDSATPRGPGIAKCGER